MPNPSAQAETPGRLAVHRSRHLIPPFRFLRAASFAEARRMLDDVADGVPMAGGLDVVTRMKEGAGPSAIVWLGGIAGPAVEQREGSLVLSATCRHDQFVQSPLAAELCPGLVAAWSHIANIRIRNQGTVVGNLMAGAAGYEAAVLLMAANASLAVLLPGGGEGRVRVAELAGEDGSVRPMPGLVTAVHIPLPPPGCTSHLGYDRSLRPALSVALGLERQGGVVRAAIGVLAGCHERPILRHLPMAGTALQALRGDAGRVASAAFAALPPPSVPWYGQPGYPALMAPLLLSRLLTDAAQ